MARVALQGPFGMINEELANIYRRNESTESLTRRAEKDQLKARESDQRIYQKLKLLPSLSYGERKALNRVMSANERAMGNLVLQTGNKKAARDCYKHALLLIHRLNPLLNMSSRTCRTKLLRRDPYLPRAFNRWDSIPSELGEVIVVGFPQIQSLQSQ